MFSDLFGFFSGMLNFSGINWWTLLGGIGLNFVITTFLSLGGTYLAGSEGTSAFYQQFGPLIMIVAIFVTCAGAGYITAKIADDVPVKHAFLASLGAVAPLVFVAVISFNPMLLMLALVAAAGALNGGMLGTPRPRRRPPSNTT